MMRARTSRIIPLVLAGLIAAGSATGAGAGNPIDYWTGKGGHFFGGKCCYCVPAERHEERDGVHYFWVDGKELPVAADKVRLTPDPKGRIIYYCSGGLHLPDKIPHDRCGLIRGTG